MDDKTLDEMLRNWAEENEPDENRREEILQNVFARFSAERTEQCSSRSSISDFSVSKRRLGNFLPIVLLGAAVLLFAVVLLNRTGSPIETDPLGPKIEIVGNDPPQLEIEGNSVEKSDRFRISLLVLERDPGSESSVEFLEDTVLLARDQETCELDINGHKLFLWVFALEPSLFTFDIGIDNTGETGILAVQDRTKAVHLRSGEKEFDVFVSVL